MNLKLKKCKKRGYVHKSPLDQKYAKGKMIQDELIDLIDDQIKILKTKKCKCKL